MAKLSAVKRNIEECVRRAQKKQGMLVSKFITADFQLRLCKGALKMDTGVYLLHMDLQT